MPKTLSPTEEQVKELVELDEVLSVLDQHAAKSGSTLQRAYCRMYAELEKLRDSELAEWNAEADGDCTIYRCDQASKPYHTTEWDGPCTIYTTNSDKRSHVCEIHQAIWQEAADQEAEGRRGYLLAKQRGEDV